MNKTISFLALLLFIAFSTFAQSIQKVPFNQDVATRFTSANGLPDEPVVAIRIVNETPVAVFRGSAYRFNGSQWAVTSGIPSEPGSNYTGFPGEFGAVLSFVEFRGGKAIGTANGLYTQARGDVNWAPVLPQDSRYKWAPVNVSVLGVDANGADRKSTRLNSSH